MTLYLLDTDIISLFQHGHSAQVRKSDLRIAAIALECAAVLVRATFGVSSVFQGY
jgi:hypothetical protein